MLFVTFTKGHFLSLEKALLGAGVKGKVKRVTLSDGTKLSSMAGAKAPQLWADGEHEAVLTYLRADVEQLLELARVIENTKYIRWQSTSGRDQSMHVEEFPTVRECFNIAEPDVSWMESPPRREQFVQWMPNIEKLLSETPRASHLDHETAFSLNEGKKYVESKTSHPSLNRLQLIGRLPKYFKHYRFENEFIIQFDLNVETGYQAFFPISIEGSLAVYCKEHWREDCLIYLEGKLSIFDKDSQGSSLVTIEAHKIRYLEHVPFDKYVSANKDTVETVIRGLEIIGLDPYADHTMIGNLIKDLNSLDLDEID